MGADQVGKNVKNVSPEAACSALFGNTKVALLNSRRAPSSESQWPGGRGSLAPSSGKHFRISFSLKGTALCHFRISLSSVGTDCAFRAPLSQLLSL